MTSHLFLLVICFGICQIQPSFQDSGRLTCPPVSFQRGEVRQRPPGVLEFRCNEGFVLRGLSRIKCHQWDSKQKMMPRCVKKKIEAPENIQNDQPLEVDYDDEDPDQYGDYYDYNYEDYDDDENYVASKDYVEEAYPDYDEPTYDHSGLGDDEDYYTMEGSGDVEQVEAMTTQVPDTTTPQTFTSTTTTTTKTTIATTTSTTTTTTTTTKKTMPSMPTDDEDFYEGSGSGYGYEEDKEDMEQGSGDFYITPQEVDTLRRRFYSQHEVDLLRLDTSCQDQFISAPQIFHAQISQYNHQVSNEAMPGQFFSKVHYRCDEHYHSQSLQLFCSEGQWKGKRPECTLESKELEEIEELDFGEDEEERQKIKCTEEEASQCEHACEIVDQKAICLCPIGYEMVAGKCQDVDECAEANGGCDQLCTNKPGSALCGCTRGYTLAEDGQRCIDDNECLLNNGHGPCQDICTNTEGSYQCSCQTVAGTLLDEDGHTCQSTDGCNNDNGGCSHKCIDSYSQVFCLCPEGFNLASDWKTCRDENECLKDNGGCEQVCTNRPGSFSCQCHVGFRKMEAEGTCQDVNECDEIPALCGHGDCQNLPGTYLCQCHPGFLLSAEGSCVDVNECSEDESICGPHGRCVNLVGTFECLCDKGFQMENQTCVDTNECRTQNNPCLNGECINQAPGYSCQCYPGFHQVNGVCVDSDECRADTQPCGLGECVNTPGAYECLCPQGFFWNATYGNICQDIDECSLEVNGSSTCGPHGDCRNLEGDFECLCHQGFRSISVQDKSCQDVDECDELEPCSEGSTCVNQVGSFECMCPSGYHSINKTQCEDTNECLSQNDCQQECINLPGSYRCACKSGFTLVEDGVSCQDEDECLVEKGGCSDTCRNTEGGHLCECPKGFRLGTDDRTCQLVEKKKNPCNSHQQPLGGFLKCTARKKKGFFPVGTRCRLKCRRGYKYQPLSGPLKTSCQDNGQWSQLGSCTAKAKLRCDPLPYLENGTIDPPNCNRQEQIIGGTKCSFNCQAGYQLQGQIQSTTCSSRTGKWSNDMPRCKLAVTNFPKPFIMCPADITKPLSGHSSSAYVMIPQPKTNVDWSRYVDAEPSWAKHLEGEMTRGRHVITFRARSPIMSASATSASCQMIIHVKDMEAPRVQQCPRSFTEMLAPGQSVKKITWTEPVFSDNVKIQHVMASFLPGHFFSAGSHNILYQASDADGNRAKCGFTITVLANHGGQVYHQQPSSSTTSSTTLSQNSRNTFNQHHWAASSSASNRPEDDLGEEHEESKVCDEVPSLENGQMLCRPYGHNGKRCSPNCHEGHTFYQKFSGRPPTYLCLPPRRIDWKIRKFIPDCSPTHQLSISGRQCEAGWEHREGQCIACPPGMYRLQKDHLCQLCPKGLYSDQFGSAKCVRCPLHHTTRGLGSKKASQCYYHRPAVRSSLLDRRKPRNKTFMYYNRWMQSASSKKT